MIVSPKLLNIVLQEFQSTLHSNLNHGWETRFGQPPKYGYVKQTEWMDDTHGNAPVISAWHISESVIHASSIKDALSPTVDGIFFDLLHGWFYFSNDLSVVFINWQTGPRFGKGFRHRIGQDTLGEYLLDRGNITWVS